MHVFSTLALASAAGVSALVARNDDTCCFSLTASGTMGGQVGELDDGQVRVGQSNLPTMPGKFCINNNGGLTDSYGRGCILTPPTTQFQCDTGAKPDEVFSVGCDYTLMAHGSSEF
ncbi:hypothetical protein MBLNU230_g2564t1 [Neophaeotheca triangularis]